MGIGAQDYIDKLLVKKYATQKVDNHESLIQSMVDPEKMLETMNDLAQVQRGMMALSNKLNDICLRINSKARYKCGKRFTRSFV